MGTLRTEDRPPSNNKGLPLLRIKDPNVHLFTILSNRVFGVWTHWNGHQSIPCWKTDEPCRGCQKGLPARWKGYLYVMDHRAGGEGFLELTPRCVESLENLVADIRQLRGERVQVRRTSRGNHGRLELEVLAKIGNLPATLAARSPLETLGKLWGLSASDLVDRDPIENVG